MERRLTEAGRENVRSERACAALYEWASRVAYKYAPGMPALDPKPEEIYILLAESIDELAARRGRGYPPGAWWDKPRYELGRACRGGGIPDAELDRATALTLSMLLVCALAIPETDGMACAAAHLTDEIQAHVGADEAARISLELAALCDYTGMDHIAGEVTTILDGEESALPPPEAVEPSGGRDGGVLEKMVEDALMYDDANGLRALKSRLLESGSGEQNTLWVERINKRIKELLDPRPTEQTVNHLYGGTQINHSALQSPVFGGENRAISNT